MLGRPRTLRVTLLTILLSLTFLTVSLVGFSGYLLHRNTADDLSGKLLASTSERIDHRIDDLVHTATSQGDVNLQLFDGGVLSPDNFNGMAGYWGKVLQVRRQMSNIYLTLEKDGTSLVVANLPNRGLTIQELRPARRDIRDDGSRGPHEMNLFNYRLEEYRLRALLAPRAAGLLASPAQGPLLASAALGSAGELEATRLDLDQRQWEWYQRARKEGRSVWVDTYLFFDEKGVPSYPGVSYASPLYKDGKLVGVLGIDFDVYVLCRYLAGLDVSQNGYAFVVEQRRDGSRQLIAHPRQEILLRQTAGPGGEQLTELVPLSGLKDRLVVEFLEQVPAQIDPEALQGSHRVRFQHDGRTYLGIYRGLEEPVGTAPRWLICIVLPEDDVLADAKRSLLIVALIGVGVLLTAGLLSYLTAGQVARPLEELVRETEEIGHFELSPRRAGHSLVLEVDRLASATEDMKASLRSFRKYVPAELVRQVLASGQEAVLGGEQRQLTIYFSDIADFTAISESMSPDSLVAHLGEYLQVLSEQILEAGGTVDKYIGDGIMAFWGAPLANAGHALSACTAAVRNQQLLRQLRERWQSEGKPPFRARIGINTGEVIVGNIGSEARLDYTVIGDAVNLASRLEGLNKYYSTEILIAESTCEEARPGIVVRPIDWVSVKGKSTAVLVYELLGLKGEVGPGVEEFADLFGHALRAYRRQDWGRAVELFGAVLRQRPDDGPAQEMLRRCDTYRAGPPAPDWDGVHHMTSK
jgi:adenylate cyclase